MIVIDTFDRFHQQVADEEWIVHMLYIVGLGKPVTTLHEWKRIRGNVMSEEAARITVFHEPMHKIKAEFELAKSVAADHAEVVHALRAITLAQE